MHYLILLFQQNEAWIGPETCLPLNCLNLPGSIETVKADVCWRLQFVSYEHNTETLIAEVDNYAYPFEEFPTHQLELLDEVSVKAIRFLRLDTLKLIKHVVFKKVMYEELPQSKFSTKNGGDEDDPEELDILKEDGFSIITEAKKLVEPGIIWEQTYKVPLQNIRFGFGVASMVFYVHPLMQQETFTIENVHLRPEFDAVKEYFGKKLGGKQIDVKVWVEQLADGSFQNNITAKALSKIDAGFIESIRFELVRKSFKTQINAEVNKALFTPDELLGQFNRNLPGMGSFYDDAQTLFDDLLSVQGSKHYKHLRYLSSLHAADTMKLRFVLQPFSFIFLVKGQQQFHLIWETLDSQEATYLWHTAKTLQALKVQLHEVEQIINTVKVQGKIAYLNDRPENLTRVFHDYSNLADGFVKWKASLDEKLL